MTFISFVKMEQFMNFYISLNSRENVHKLRFEGEWNKRNIFYDIIYSNNFVFVWELVYSEILICNAGGRPATEGF